MRYIVLVLLNLPIIILALVNLITNYKINKSSSRHFKHQLFLWLIILIILVCSFPFYNFIIGRPLLDASELSLFDIVEVTIIIYLIYAANNQRRRLERNERIINQLHQELAIILSEEHGKN